MPIDDRIKYLITQQDQSDTIKALHDLIHELGRKLDALTERVGQLEARPRTRKIPE